MKRVDLLLDALERKPSLSSLSFRIFGGAAGEALQTRVEQRHPNVRLMGFSTTIGQELAGADAFVHTCSREAFGLAVLEAMAAKIPVLVPDGGGAGEIVVPNDTGYRFRADDADDLACQLEHLREAPADELNRIVTRAQDVLSTRFSEHDRIDDYRRLIRGSRCSVSQA
jgi:glycosyltransferase involved in cell wall biosynthesis